MAKDFLPIGSVVKLVDSAALVMVAGYLPVAESRSDYVWDYLGFKFPIGYTDDEDLYCFDHSQIETIYAYGYKDIEQEIFMSRLNVARDEVAKMVKNGEAAKEAEEEPAPADNEEV